MNATPLYKATRPDGTDFRTGTVVYAGALASGQPVNHPSSMAMVPDLPATYLSTSVEPAETLLGGSWPCRLFRVEPVGNVLDGLDASSHKRAMLSMKVVEELPAWQALGPNGQVVVRVIELAGYLSAEQADRLGAARPAARYAAWSAARSAAWSAARDAAWDAARDAAWDAAWSAAWDAAWDASHAADHAAAWGAARDAARDAALAYVVKDLITAEQFQMLAGPWISVMGAA